MQPRHVAVDFLLTLLSLGSFGLAHCWLRSTVRDYLLMACAHWAWMCAFLHHATCAGCRAAYVVAAARRFCLCVLCATIGTALASDGDSQRGVVLVCATWANAAYLSWQIEAAPTEEPIERRPVEQLAASASLILFYIGAHGMRDARYRSVLAIYTAQHCSYVLLLSFIQCGHRLAESGELQFECLIGAQQLLLIGAIAWDASHRGPLGVMCVSQLMMLLLWARLRLQRHRAALDGAIASLRVSPSAAASIPAARDAFIR